ncbi:hypothetical protein [Roseovarius aestuariivivens]|nr:hypothetical protein [Roseovarius aestuariivivens]
MTHRFWLSLAFLGSMTALQACAPAIGAGAVVAADQIIEEEEGGDGIF